jgi:membrane protein YdbS with pleckstrin-like domain
MVLRAFPNHGIGIILRVFWYNEAMIVANQFLKLPPKVRTYWLIKLFLKLLIIYFLTSVFFGIFRDVQILVSVFWFFIIIGIPFAIYEIIFYNSIRFSVADDKVTINSGIITKHSTTIPFQNIQNVDTVSGLMQRIFAISTLNIWTASPGQLGIVAQKGKEDTSHGPDGRLWLDTQDAQWLKDFIATKRHA